MAMWKSSASYAQRLADIRTGGADGLYALQTSTVLDDGVADYLYGRPGAGLVLGVPARHERPARERDEPVTGTAGAMGFGR